MKKKLDELKVVPKDVNSPESQEFLRKLHEELVILHAKFREDMKKYGVIFDNELK
jgi:hypothetical protein